RYHRHGQGRRSLGSGRCGEARHRPGAVEVRAGAAWRRQGRRLPHPRQPRGRAQETGSGAWRHRCADRDRRGGCADAPYRTVHRAGGRVRAKPVRAKPVRDGGGRPASAGRAAGGGRRAGLRGAGQPAGAASAG
ncbi:hypothetical protein OY671_009965, partial [Metschnikowia pulcherrima]